MASTGWVAVYRTNEEIAAKQPGRVLPVDGWSSNGYALVVDKRNGVRTEANTVPNFRGLRQDEPTPVAVIPGAGWMVEWNNGSKPSAIVGWAVDSNSWGVALLADSDGSVSPLDSIDEGWLVPPGFLPEDSPYRPDES